MGRSRSDRMLVGTGSVWKRSMAHLGIANNAREQDDGARHIQLPPTVSGSRRAFQSSRRLHR